MSIRANADYQQFSFGKDGSIENIRGRMLKKMEAIPLPHVNQRDILDIGCDFGFWSFLSSYRGAGRVVGLDRNRNVRSVGPVDLISMNQEVARTYPVHNVCEFYHIDIGKQWKRFGSFDVIFLFSLYHHIYQNTGGDHNPIWYWLWRQASPSGILVWENPTTANDTVVLGNVERPLHDNYNESAIMSAAGRYFTSEYVGPAKHEATRDVFNFYPRTLKDRAFDCSPINGAGGASKAFSYHNFRRCREIEYILGFDPYPGSLNLALNEDFNYDEDYYRAQVLDVKDRSRGLDSEWVSKWARFYPVTIEGQDAYAFRFEGEKYPRNFVELIAPIKLRDHIEGPTKLWRLQTTPT